MLSIDKKSYLKILQSALTMKESVLSFCLANVLKKIIKTVKF